VRRRRFNVGRVLALNNPSYRPAEEEEEIQRWSSACSQYPPCRIARLVRRRAPALHRAHDAPRVLSHYGILHVLGRNGNGQNRAVAPPPTPPPRAAVTRFPVRSASAPHVSPAASRPRGFPAPPLPSAPSAFHFRCSFLWATESPKNAGGWWVTHVHAGDRCESVREQGRYHEHPEGRSHGARRRH